MATLDLSNDFNCSKEKLYSAWTEPEQLKQWWKPLGKQLVEVVNDLVEGGSVSYRFNDDSLLIDGNYEQVTNQELLVYTWNWHIKAEPVNDASYKLTVNFKGDENNSSLSIRQDGFESEESIHPHQHGWEQGLDQLKQYLGNEESAPSDEDSETHQPPVTGYNETPEQAKVGGG
ncbi:MAG: SRPBCC family protein [Chitinophagaceae bacterium]